MLDFKLGLRPQKSPSPGSQIAQDVLEQTEMISQDITAKSRSPRKQNSLYRFSVGWAL